MRYIRVSNRTTGDLGDRECLQSINGHQLQHGASTWMPTVARSLISTTLPSQDNNSVTVES